MRGQKQTEPEMYYTEPCGAEATLNGIGWTVNRRKTAQLALGKNLPLSVVDAIYHAGRDSMWDELSLAALHKDMRDKAERYDYCKLVDGWLFNVVLFLTLVLMCVLKYDGIL